MESLPEFRDLLNTIDKEALVHKRPVRRVGVCQFRETELFDYFLRLIRESFGFGTGALILRAVAGPAQKSRRAGAKPDTKPEVVWH